MNLVQEFERLLEPIVGDLSPVASKMLAIGILFAFIAFLIRLVKGDK